VNYPYADYAGAQHPVSFTGGIGNSILFGQSNGSHTTAVGYDRVRDGLSYTLMLAEKGMPPSDYATSARPVPVAYDVGWNATASGTTLNAAMVAVPNYLDRFRCPLYLRTDKAAAYTDTIGSAGGAAGMADGDMGTLHGAAHVTVCNVLMADGAVKGMATNIPSATLLLLWAYNDGSQVPVYE
jgi:hypothetical protein